MPVDTEKTYIKHDLHKYRWLGFYRIGLNRLIELQPKQKMLFWKSDGLSAGLPNSIIMINCCQSTFPNDMLVYLIAVVNSQQRFLRNW